MQPPLTAAYRAASLTFHTTNDDQQWDHQWDQWLAAQGGAHVLQLSGWRRLKQGFDWRGVALVGTHAQGEVVSGCQFLLKRAAGLTLAYAPRGPVTDWSNRFETELLLQALHHEARRRGAVVLKIEPDLPDSPANRALLGSYGFVPSGQTVQPPSTIVLDIGGTEDEVLGRMKSKWRYNVRLAQRKEVCVRALAREELPRFYALMQATGTRDGFGIHSADYFAAAYDLLVPQHAVFLLAEYAGEPLGAIVVAAVGDTACYLWGASSDRERNRMPNHLLQWEGMRWARSRGASRYDFWGIPDPIGQLAAAMRGGDGSGTPSDELPIDLEALPAGELWGVYRFKQGFGGNVVRTVGAWDMALDTIGFRVYQLGLNARSVAGALPHSPQALLRELTHAGAPLPGATPASTARRDLGTLASGAAPPQAACTLVDTAEEWRAVLGELPEPHVLQSWEWGEVKAQTGWYARRYRVAGGAGQATAQAAFQLLWRQPLGPLPLRVAYVPKGPVLDWTDLDMVDIMLDAIEREARRLHCIYVKIDPDVRRDTPTGRLVLHALERRGWQFSHDQVQFQNTARSDLAVGEEALLAQMKQKWRYNVRLAEKRGITVRQGREVDFPAFYALYKETGARDGFLIRPYEYYAATWRTFLRAEASGGAARPAASPAGGATGSAAGSTAGSGEGGAADILAGGSVGNPAGGMLLLAEHPDNALPIAGIFLFRYGRRAWYFYGASSERHRRDMPNYLLQWEALRWALAHGCTVYDWWGAPTDPDDPADPMQGVWQFKQGFGAVLHPHIGAWDFAVSPPLYGFYQEAMPAVLDWMRSHH